MRRRLMVALVSLVAGGLIVAGAGSLVLTRNSARNQARQQLVTEVQSLTSHPLLTQSVPELKVIQRVLSLEDARLVGINLAGTVVRKPPSGLTKADLDPVQLLAGQTVSGRKGNLVFAAAPVTLSARERARLKFGGQVAIVLTRQVGYLGPGWGYFLAAGGVTLVIAALVASQMSRRMTRPLIEATEVTGRIASGDLGSRVPIHEGDYTEFSSLARSINAMAQSLADGRARERQLLLSVSHDLRTPLTSIRGFAEAITDGAIDDTTQGAEVIIAESRRLERLVGDLLDLGKLEAQQLSFHVRPTDLAEVVGITAEGFRPLAEKGGLNLSVEVPDEGMAPVAADPDRVAQLLANLIENALTFARTSVRVTLGETAPPGTPVVVVQDDGPGIASADLPRVFDRFYQADRGPNRKVGSGLGLAIVSELASAMGATVRAESPIAENGGSRFIVTLQPRREGAELVGSGSAP
ncbi:MAG TPA: HAMP domain-containing sensor histidine kinase [Acidimicrobiales bacterium]|nr:HAMP domain-containing sensor histidine kinase [Acidimicrobiales bacterium]